MSAFARVALVVLLAVAQALATPRVGQVSLGGEQEVNKTENSATLSSETSPNAQNLNETGQQLQAEESRVQETLALAVLAPSGEPSKLQAASFHGGPDNSYMSISRDGSNRYEFGFDTGSARAPPEVGARRAQARLMREESRLADGTVIGRYGYTDPFNVFRVVQYVAGQDGYFATEDVGAMAQSVQTQSQLGRPARPFELNRQLHKALEQARALRLRRRQLAEQPKEAAAAAAGSLGPGERPEVGEADTEERGGGGGPDEELLAGSGTHNSVRFATRINHVVGNNGVTYATAFRPQLFSPSAPAPAPQATGQLAALETGAPVAVAPTYASMRMSLGQRDARSQLPAPLPLPATSAFDFQQASQPQSPPPQPSWSVLANNYRDQPEQHSLSLLIDHSAGGLLWAPLAPVPHRAGAEFGREAALLASIAHRQQNQQQQSGQFGARTSAPAEPQSYAFALKHFDAPLYRPEVHETSQTGAEQRAPVPEPIVHYASTVVHSELAAEQDHTPERLQAASGAAPTGGPQPAGDLVRSASEGRVAYATRLTSLAGPAAQARHWNFVNENEELSMEDSEQVAAYAANSTSGLSRARLPD